MAMADTNYAIHRLTRDEIEGSFDRAMRLRLGELIYCALPEFYEHIPIERSTLFSLLADQVDLPLTELSETYGFRDAGLPLGILSVIDSRDVKRSQMAGALMIIRELGGEATAAFNSAVAKYRQSVEDRGAFEGKYIPRIAVSPEARAKGVARALINHVIGLYPDVPIALHVAQTNIAGTNLYASLGFKPQSDTTLPIRVLVRPPAREAESAMPRRG